MSSILYIMIAPVRCLRQKNRFCQEYRIDRLAVTEHIELLGQVFSGALKHGDRYRQIY